MEKEIQTHAKQTEIPEDMWEAVGALREALFDNPCVILDTESPEGEDRHYFFSDPELYAAIQKVVENLPGQAIHGKSYVALACALQKHGVICESALTNATEYDGGKTLRGILRAFEDLHEIDKGLPERIGKTWAEIIPEGGREQTYWLLRHND